MGLDYQNLTEDVRALMAEEARRDIDTGTLYYSKQFTAAGRSAYPRLLLQAIESGSDDTLALNLRTSGAMARYRRDGRRVPWNAAETIAESEFNRFYIRGLCRFAMDGGIDQVEIYRAKRVRSPRARSQSLIGQRRSPAEVLGLLRDNIGVEGAFGLPPGPNSGISVRLPCSTTTAATA